VPDLQPRYKPFKIVYNSRSGRQAPPTLSARFLVLGDELAGSSLLEFDSNLELYREAKKSRPGNEPPDRDELTDTERALVASRLLADVKEQPLRAELARAGGLCELVSLIQEDLVVMRKQEGEQGKDARAAYVNVSFPSGWCPSCIRGSTFAKIHARVPEDGTFAQRHRDGLAARLWCGDVPEVRFVWTVAPDQELDRRDCRAGRHETRRLCTWKEATGAFLRVERQVILQIDECLSAFLIRVYVHDVNTLDVEEQRELLHAVESISSNTDIALYKGFHGNLDEIRRWFRL
jgi:hypothetical protein